MQGAEFERAYVIHQVADHVKAVLKYRDASQMAKNDQLKSFASQALPKLQQHLQQASQIAGWDESAITAGASERGTRSGADRSSSTPGSGSDRSNTSGSDRSRTGGSDRSPTGTNREQ